MFFAAKGISVHPIVMRNLPIFPRFASLPAVAGVLGAVVLAGTCFTPSVHSQAPAATTPNATLAPLLAKLKAQQTQIVANQTKIETQTALLKEELRQAKIYSGRGGSGHR